MSYIEHGQRIFSLGGKPTLPLIYGDYVLPKKRSEGKIKVYDSCCDIRAWSSNPLENARYFRELAEHPNEEQIGKVIPTNVLIDNLLGLGSQAHQELLELRRQLKKYKSLKLTKEQERCLKQFDKNQESDELQTSDRPVENSSEDELQRDLYQKESYNFISKRDAYAGPDYTDSDKEDVIKVDAEVQVYFPWPETRVPRVQETGMISDITCSSSKSEYSEGTSCVGNLDDSNNKVINDTESITASSNNTFSQTACCHETRCCSSSSSIATSSHQSETLSENELKVDEYSHKSIIIEKDSEIIALKNELGAKEAEIEELKELQRNLEGLLKDRENTLNVTQENLKKTQGKLEGLANQRSDDMQKMKQTMLACKCLVTRLKKDLYVQKEESDELRLKLKDVESITSERDALARKMKEMSYLQEKAEKVEVAYDQMRAACQERDELRKEIQEQGSILADQEEEIKKLLSFINNVSAKSNHRQMKMEEALKDMQAEVAEKNKKIHECEEQFVNLTGKLKNNMMNSDRCRFSPGTSCSCNSNHRDIYAEAKETLHYLKSIIRERRSSKELNLKEDAAQTFSNNSTSSSDDSKTVLHSDTQTGEMSVSNLRQRKSILQEELKKLNEELEKRTALKMKVIEQEILETNYSTDEINTKETNDRLNRVRIDFDNWKKEKAILECTIDELNAGISLLTNNDNEEGQVERKFVGVASKLIVKMGTLVHQLDNYRIENLPYTIDSTSAPNDRIIVLRAELKEALRDVSYDEKIDKALALHVKRSIERINKISSALQGAGDERVEIVKEIAKQRNIIDERNAEIMRLKDQIASNGNFQRGEGDHPTDSNRLQNVQEKLVEKVNELDEKDRRVRELQDEIQSYRLKFDEVDEKYRRLENRIRELQEECREKSERIQSNEEEIENLRIKVNNSKRILKFTDELERKIEEMEPKLKKLHKENESLIIRLAEANKTIGNFNERLQTILSKDEETMRNMSLKHTKEIQEKFNEIEKLKTENLKLTESLRTDEEKILKMYTEIDELRKENEQVNHIYQLQTEVLRLNKDKKKLSDKVADSVKKLAEHEALNRQLENELNSKLQKNEDLKSQIEELRARYVAVFSKTELNTRHKEQIFELPKKICDSITSLKRQLENKGSSFLEDITSREKLEKENEILRNRVKDLEDKLEIRGNERSKNEKLNDDVQGDVSEKIRELEFKIKGKDSEILKLKNILMEKEKQYMNSLTAIKRKYDMGLKSIHEKHNESVRRLAMKYAEVVRDNAFFDPDSWLKSLNIKELEDLHGKICKLNECLRPSSEMKEVELISNPDKKKDIETDGNEKQELIKKIDDLEKEIVQRQKDAEFKICELELIVQKEHKKIQKLHEAMTMEQQRNNELQNRLWLISKNQNISFGANQSENSYAPLDISSYVGRNYHVANLDEILKRSVETRDLTVDYQTKNFINQCSSKYGNTH